MNNLRRKQLNRIIEALERLHMELDMVMSDEEDYMDNIPENLQGGRNFSKSEESCDNMRMASDSFDELIEYIKDAIS